MITDSYDLAIGIYIAVILFFLAYWLLGSKGNNIMKNTSLNWIFMAFFIIIFFLLGYLFSNLLVQFREVRSRSVKNTVIEMES